MRRSILALCLCLSAAPLRAQEPERPGLLSLLSVDTLATAVFNSLVQSARSLADIRYDQISFDARALRITLTNLDVSPYLGGREDCRATARRAILRGGAIDRPDTSRFHMTLDGVAVSSGCLPPMARPLMAALEKTDLELPNVGVDLALHIPSGGAQLRATAALADLTTAELFVDADYVSYRMDYNTEEPRLALDLTQASLTLTDQGAVALARRMGPAEQTSPEAVAILVRALLTGALTETHRTMPGLPAPDTGNGAAAPAAGPNDAQKAFIDDAAEAARKLAEGDTQVVISTGPHVPPVHLDIDSAASAAGLFDRLSPAVGTTAPALQRAFSADVLRTAQKGKADPEQALQLGRAFATGVGAPLNRSQALRLLEPLTATTPEAAYLSARILSADAPAEAYALSLSAAQANWPGALALLDEIEDRLDYTTLIGAQENLTAATRADPPASALGMGLLASAYAGGIGEIRSYPQAYYWATLAAAAGNAAAAMQRDDLNEFFRLRGDANAWRVATDRIEAQVLEDWIDRDLMGAAR